MLNFVSEPTKGFALFVENALENSIGYVEAVDNVLQDGENPFYYLLSEEYEMFDGFKNIIKICESLLEALKSDKMHRLSEYHWLLLDRILHEYCDTFKDGIINFTDENSLKLINLLKEESVKEGEEFSITDSDELFDWCLSFFWDTDYDENVENFSSKEVVKQVGFGKTAFGCASRLAPHPDELKLIPVDDFDFAEWRNG